VCLLWDRLAAIAVLPDSEAKNREHRNTNDASNAEYPDVQVIDLAGVRTCRLPGVLRRVLRAPCNERRQHDKCR
jgi:hypothetical protein